MWSDSKLHCIRSICLTNKVLLFFLVLEKFLFQVLLCNVEKEISGTVSIPSGGWFGKKAVSGTG